MEYIINTTFLGDDISYDLIEGKFDFQKDDNPITLVDSFQSLVKQRNILKDIMILFLLPYRQQMYVI